MAIRNLAGVALAFLLAWTAAQAQQAPQVNVSGRWTGTLTPQGDGESKRVEKALFVLRQEGDVVTGTAGPDETERFEITKGKLATTKDGTTLTFDLARGPVFMQFELKYVDGKFTGGVKADRDGKKMTAVFELERAK